MKKILITGGAGFVGRHFTRHFLDQGDSVYVVDNLAPFTGAINPADGWPLFNPLDYQNFHFINQDCRDFFSTNVNTYFDYSLHLAAMVGGRLMIENNPIAVADDLSIDAHYWQWAVKAKPAKTLCFSSSAAYPINLQTENGYQLLSEEMINFDGNLGMPDMSYGWAKLTCEYLARLAFEKHGLESVCYRPFSGYGEDQDDTYPFPSICKRAIDQMGSQTLSVWGAGTQMRDFIHIDDCVSGVIKTMDKVNNGQAINLSTGRFTSFLEFAKITANILGYNPKVIGTSNTPTGVFARGGDTKFQRELGFKFQIELEDGIRNALNYYSSQ